MGNNILSLCEIGDDGEGSGEQVMAEKFIVSAGVDAEKCDESIYEFLCLLYILY